MSKIANTLNYLSSNKKEHYRHFFNEANKTMNLSMTNLQI